MPARSDDLWIAYRPELLDLLGFIPDMLNGDDPRPAKDQLDSAYQHGGGWCKFDGFAFTDGDKPTISYPGDPPIEAIAETRVRNERVIVFPHAWVMVVQPDGAFEVARLD